jgi:DNA-binding transcriptional ArsR family regulator
MSDDVVQSPSVTVDELMISDLETLKVLADPLRLNIISYLRKPGTVKQVATRIDKPPTKLYYHFNLLEKHGLIQMVDTRIVSGIVEKHYQRTAKTYKVAPGLLSPGAADFDEGLSVTLGGVFGAAHEDLRESMMEGLVDLEEEAPKHRRLMLTQGRLRLKPEEAEDFYSRLDALLEEFSGLHEKDEDTQLKPYAMLLLLHPSKRSE